MKRIAPVTFLFFFLFQFGNSQSTFQITLGGVGADKGACIYPAANGDYLICGRTSSYGGATDGAVAIRIDPNGTTKWISTLDGSGLYWAKGIIELPDSTILVAGHTGNSNYNKLLYKLDKNGNIIWYKSDGVSNKIELARQLRFGPYGEIYMAGYSHNTWNPASDGFIAKYDTAGNVQWNWNYGNTHNDWLVDFNPSLDNHLMFCGYREAYPGDPGWEAIVAKADTAGNIVWSSKYGLASNQHFDAIVNVADSGFMLCGIAENGGFGQDDWMVTRLDKNGDVLWCKSMGGTQDERPTTIIRTSDDHYVVVGWTQSFGQGGRDFMMMKIDTAGNILWTKTYGGAGNEFTWVVKELWETLGGGFIFGGETTSFGAGSTDIMIVKTDSLGRTPGCDYDTVNLTTNNIALLRANHPINKATTAGVYSPTLTVTLGTDTSGFLCCPSVTPNFTWMNDCSSDTMTFNNLSAPTYGSTQYQWDFNNDGVIDDTSGGNVTAVLAPGTHSVKLISIDSCGKTDSVIVQVISSQTPIAVNLGPDTSYCSMTTYTLNAGSGGNNYLWNTGATTQTLTPNTSGTYSVLVTDTNGCTGSDTVQLAIFQTPFFTLSAPPMCEGDTSLCVTANPSGYNYTWSNGGTGDSICPNLPGTYIATALDTNTGCSFTDTLIAPMFPGPFVNLGPDTAICPGDTICKTTGLIGGSQWVWSNGDTTSTSCLSAGVNYVNVYDTNQCCRGDTIHITEKPAIQSGFTIDSIECPLFVFTDSSTGGSGLTYLWDFGNGITSTAQNPQHNYQPSGNGQYLVQLIVSDGCGSDTSSYLLNVTCLTSNETWVENNFAVYPNPADQKVVISSKINFTDLAIEMFDEQGRLVLEVAEVLEREFDLDVSNQPNGIYFLHLRSSENLGVVKLVIQR